jgi:hypothetical protein
VEKDDESRIRNAILVPRKGALTSSTRYSGKNEGLEAIIVLSQYPCKK